MLIDILQEDQRDDFSKGLGETVNDLHAQIIDMDDSRSRTSLIGSLAASNGIQDRF